MRWTGESMSIAAPRSWTKVTVDGQSFLRQPVRTRWLTERDDLAEVLSEHLLELEPGDTVAISEKVALLLEGGAVPTGDVRVGREARLLASFVRPRPGSRGLSVPEKMAYVLRRSGRVRIYAAAAGGAIGRLLGVKGTFYRVAGSLARDIDGGRPPYEHLLFPPFEPERAAQVCAGLEQRLGVGVAIVDINDFGGSVRSVSPRSLPASTLTAVLADNPMRQRLTGTPFAVVRPS
jgi:F420-0:gamma-glutamyl ligase